MTERPQADLLTRRQILGAMGAAGVGLLLAESRALSRLGGLNATAAATASASCVLTPEQTEGPFYVDLERTRRNIVSGRPGVPLVLRLRVIDTDTCKPIHNAAVDIWHCDALGAYSDEASEGTAGRRFLRGVQLTDRHGYAEFRTIYPGHYKGRTTHIHVKVHVGGRRSGKRYAGGHVSHTGQLFFPEAISNTVYRLAPYSRDATERTRNSADQIYTGQHGSHSVLTLRRRGSSLPRKGYRGTMTFGVDPSATPNAV